MKKLLLVGWYLLAMVLICFLIEGAVRIFAGHRINFQGTSSYLYQENVYGPTHGLKAGASGKSFGKMVHVNRLGLRGPEIKLNQSSRILLLLGDSVLFGVGVADSQTVGYLLWKNLTNENRVVLNAGVIAYNAADYVNVAKYWLNKQPAEGVVLFYVLNDVYQQKPDLEKHRQVPVLESIFSFFRRNSKAYLWLKNVALDRGKNYFLYDYNFYKENKPEVATAIKDISQIQKLAESHHTKLAVVLLPYRYQYMDAVPDPWLPQRMMQDSLSRRNITCIDARQVFEHSKDVNRFYLYGDPMHFSAEGHRRVAEFFLQQLNKIDF